MPIQYGRNPKSYPPNDNYRREWERIFGEKRQTRDGVTAPKHRAGKRVQRAVTRPATLPPDVSGASEAEQ